MPIEAQNAELSEVTDLGGNVSDQPVPVKLQFGDMPLRNGDSFLGILTAGRSQPIDSARPLWAIHLLVDRYHSGAFTGGGGGRRGGRFLEGRKREKAHAR